MTVPSHVIEADLNRLSARLSSLERKVANLSTSSPAPAALPVDKMQLADYGKVVSRLLPSEEVDEDDEEEDVISQPNLSKADLQELAAAVRDYLEWSAPQRHLSDASWEMVNTSARDRLERALSVAEKELRRADA